VRSSRRASSILSSCSSPDKRTSSMLRSRRCSRCVANDTSFVVTGLPASTKAKKHEDVAVLKSVLLSSSSSQSGDACQIRHRLRRCTLRNALVDFGSTKTRVAFHYHQCLCCGNVLHLRPATNKQRVLPVHLPEGKSNSFVDPCCGHTYWRQVQLFSSGTPKQQHSSVGRQNNELRYQCWNLPNGRRYAAVGPRRRRYAVSVYRLSVPVPVS
jgi:hypothetical protein